MIHMQTCFHAKHMQAQLCDTELTASKDTFVLHMLIDFSCISASKFINIAIIYCVYLTYVSARMKVNCNQTYKIGHFWPLTLLSLLIKVRSYLPITYVRLQVTFIFAQTLPVIYTVVYGKLVNFDAEA